jgi:hypothetical protein
VTVFIALCVQSYKENPIRQDILYYFSSFILLFGQKYLPLPQRKHA